MNLKLLAWSGLASLSCACGNTVAQLNGQIAKEGKIVIEGTSDDLEGQGNEKKEKDPLPVTPPQPVVGSYLAARFEIPGNTSATECSYLLTEESEFFIGFIEPSAYQMLPVNDISQLKSVSIICSAGISGLEVEALKELNAEERVSLAKIVVPFENSPVQSVAAFQATTAFGAIVRGESSGGNSSETKMEFQIVDPEELKNRLIDRKSPTVLRPPIPPTPMPTAVPTPLPTAVPTPMPTAVPTPVNFPVPIPSPDVTPPTIRVVSVRPIGRFELLASIIGAQDNRKLAARPYSFDGGRTWQQEATKTVRSTSSYSSYLRHLISNGLIRVRDAAGNETIYGGPRR